MSPQKSTWTAMTAGLFLLLASCAVNNPNPVAPIAASTATPTPTVTRTPTFTPSATPTNCSSFGGAGNGSQPLGGTTHAICSSFTLSTLAMVKGLHVRLTNFATGYDVNLAIYDDVSGNPG